MKLLPAPFLLIGVLLVPTLLTAAPVDLTEARTIARAHLESLDADRSIDGHLDVTADGTALARILRLDPTGFVIVAADDGLPPVIAYSLVTDYPAVAPADNPLLRMLEADLASRVEADDRIDADVRADVRAEWTALREGVARASRFEQWPPAGSTATGGWLETNWHQNAPYNDMVPLDLAGGGARSLAGCPSVAMAMILNHHESTNGTILDSSDRYWHGYGGNNFWIPDGYRDYDFPDFDALNTHLTTLNLHWLDGAPPTNADMAALVFACGVAATQVYNAGGSGTFGVDQAFDAFKRFGFDACSLLDESDPDLYTRLIDEMQKAHPAHLAVVDPAWSVGHNLVIDGYNSNDFYHLNFGWGGTYNAWYRLPSGLPYNLTVIEGVILDILPGVSGVEGGTPLAATAPCISAAPNPFNPLTRIAFTAPTDGHAKLAIYDLAGRRLAVLLDGDVERGRNEVGWAPRGLASGVYMARVEMDGISAVTRVVLAK